MKVRILKSLLLLLFFFSFVKVDTVSAVEGGAESEVGITFEGYMPVEPEPPIVIEPPVLPEEPVKPAPTLPSTTKPQPSGKLPQTGERPMKQGVSLGIVFLCGALLVKARRKKPE